MGEFYFYKGRVALYSILKALNLKADDRILIPGYTCIVVPLAVHYLKAIPEYVDIDHNCYNALLPNYLEAYKRISNQGLANSLKGVIIQHTYGNPNKDVKAIVSWAHEKGLFVIEDCAHINGVVIDGEPVGSIGDASFFSTQWSKPFTTGLGGIARINNPSYVNTMTKLEKSAPSPGLKETMVLTFQLFVHKYLLRSSLYWFAIKTHRALSKLGIFVGSSSTCELEGKIPVDYFKGMGQVQRWLLKLRSSKMDKVNSHRVWLAKEYDSLLKEYKKPIYNREENSVLIRYPIRVKNKFECLADAEKKKIELGDWFDHPLHPAGSNINALNWEDNICPNAIVAAKEVINLPMQVYINRKRAKRIVSFVVEYILQ